MAGIARVSADPMSVLADGWAMMFSIEPERFAADEINAWFAALGAMLAPPGPLPRAAG